MRKTYGQFKGRNGEQERKGQDQVPPECTGACGVAGGDASEGPFEEARHSLSPLRIEAQHGHRRDQWNAEWMQVTSKETFRTRLFVEMGLWGKPIHFPPSRPSKDRLCCIHSNRIIKMWFFQCVFPDAIMD